MELSLEKMSPGDGRFGPGQDEMIGGPRGGCSPNDSEGHCRSGINQAWQLIALVGEKGSSFKTRCLKERCCCLKSRKKGCISGSDLP